MLLTNSLFSKLFVYACKHNSAENVCIAAISKPLPQQSFFHFGVVQMHVTELLNWIHPWRLPQLITMSRCQVLGWRFSTTNWSRGTGSLDTIRSSNVKLILLSLLWKKEYLILCLEMAKKVLQTVYTTANDPYPTSAIRKFAVACRTSLGF